ncbi:hypothetical protein NQZ68_030764 [Dissostichus eleginoides]|nr:hypothetical protein NQZ68_030764 [Dissostichus eleginoides]
MDWKGGECCGIDSVSQCHQLDRVWNETGAIGVHAKIFVDMPRVSEKRWVICDGSSMTSSGLPSRLIEMRYVGDDKVCLEAPISISCCGQWVFFNDVVCKTRRISPSVLMERGISGEITRLCPKIGVTARRSVCGVQPEEVCTSESAAESLMDVARLPRGVEV